MIYSASVLQTPAPFPFLTNATSGHNGRNTSKSSYHVASELAKIDDRWQTSSEHSALLSRKRWRWHANLHKHYTALGKVYRCLIEVSWNIQNQRSDVWKSTVQSTSSREDRNYSSLFPVQPRGMLWIWQLKEQLLHYQTVDGIQDSLLSANLQMDPSLTFEKVK